MEIKYLWIAKLRINTEKSKKIWEKLWLGAEIFVPLQPLFGVTDGGKIGELPAMLRRNDTTI